MAKVRGESDEDRIARHRRDVDAYEAAHPEVVPGTAAHAGDFDPDHPRAQHGPHGGQLWEDRARPALARRGAGIELDVTDREALERHPAPRSGLLG